MCLSCCNHLWPSWIQPETGEEEALVGHYILYNWVRFYDLCQPLSATTISTAVTSGQKKQGISKTVPSFQEVFFWHLSYQGIGSCWYIFQLNTGVACKCFFQWTTGQMHTKICFYLYEVVHSRMTHMEKNTNIQQIQRINSKTINYSRNKTDLSFSINWDPLQHFHQSACLFIYCSLITM